MVTVLLIHGGGWVGGVPEQMAPHARGLKKMGYRVVLVNYRLGSISRALIDCRAAAKKARARGDVIAVGESAGATLAANLAADGRVDGAVVYVGPADLENWPESDVIGIIWWLMGLTLPARAALSPVNRITSNCAPMLLAYGGADELVPLYQGVALRAAIRVHQSDVKLRVMPNHAHDYVNSYGRALGRRWIANRWPT